MQRDVELSKQLSRVRIHVERVIGLLKNKYLILKGPITISLLKHKGDQGVDNDSLLCTHQHVCIYCLVTHAEFVVLSL